MVATYSPHRHHGASPFFDPRSPSHRRVYNDSVPRRSPLSSPITSSSPATQNHQPYSPNIKSRSSTRRNSPVRTRSSFAAQVSPAKFALQLSTSSGLNQSLRQACGEMTEKATTRSSGRQTRSLTVPNVTGLQVMSSPLKRSDSIMNGDSPGRSTGSPKAKRRSQHGISTPRELSSNVNSSFGTPTRLFSASARRSTNIKKNKDNDGFEKPTLARSRLPFPKSASRANPEQRLKRMTSFDRYVSTQNNQESPFNIPSIPVSSPVTRGKSAQMAAQRANNPHPLSNVTKTHSTFSDSSSQTSSSFATPQNAKVVRPNQLAFMSTGLLSKRNRAQVPGTMDAPAPPDTPSKKPVVPFSTRKPPPSIYSQFDTFANRRGSFGKCPDTPFIKGNNRRQSLLRRDSFASINSFDESDNDGNGNSQGSEFDAPPTPTKGPGAIGNGSSGTFGQLGSVTRSRKWRHTASGSPIPFNANPNSPHTPDDLSFPPDPSRLSISGRPSPFLRSVAKNPPQTPTTTSRGLHGPSPGTPFNTIFNETTTPVVDRTATFAKEWDANLENRFSDVKKLGTGAFSVVFQVEQKQNTVFSPTSAPSRSGRLFAVKRIPYNGVRDLEIRLEEVKVLKALGSSQHIVQYVDDWKDDQRLYVQTEFCQYGSLDVFLAEYGNLGRLDPFRMWKIMAEITLGVKHIHDCGFIHLDIKPSNIFIGSDGTLKIGDFGMATAWPARRSLEREGDRQYMAEEVLSHRYDKPADIFSLGITMLEIAANIMLPDNGASWHKLRSGDLSEVPDLSASALTGSCLRDDFGFPAAANDQGNDSSFSELADDSFGSTDSSYCSTRSAAIPAGALQSMLIKNPAFHRAHTRELSNPPPFMAGNSLGNAIQMLLSPNPSQRPTASQILSSAEIQWVLSRKEKAALVYEGEWGPLKAFEENNLSRGCQEMFASTEDLRMHDA